MTLARHASRHGPAEQHRHVGRLCAFPSECLGSAE